MDIKGYQQSALLLERAKKVLAGGVSSEFRKYNHPHALFYTHGIGSRIYDADGNEYLDFTLSQGPLILGHSNPNVLAAVNKYSEEGQLFAGQHIKEIELAEKLQQLIPSAELMRFCLDGSEAVQTALRVARAKTGRQKFLRFEGHYHGWLDNVCYGLSAPSAEALGSPEHPNVFPWTKGLPDHSIDEFLMLPWNDLQLVQQTVEKHHHQIAAIITEPVMCNNGCIAPKESFLQGLRQLCDQYGITLIFDEVITGFRLALGGAQKYYNITPDLSIFAKALASGYPISAIAGKREWMNLIESSKVIHAGTMNTSNPTVAAALATLETLESDKPYQRMFELGKLLKDGLKQAAKDGNQNLLVQGPGPMIHTGFTSLTEVNDYRDTFTYDKVKLGRFIAAMHNKGIRIIGRGLWYISAVHTKNDIEQALKAATEVLQEL
ncbi:MAG: aspartate aminotransferase family protein [Segetibacter sp.]